VGWKVAGKWLESGWKTERSRKEEESTRVLQSSTAKQGSQSMTLHIRLMSDTE
jgi:hypothetical protein